MSDAIRTRLAGLRADRNFHLIWLGQTGSIFGDRVTGLALPWLLVQGMHDAFIASAVMAAQYGPPLIFGPSIGVLADGMPSRRLMISADVLRCLALSSIAALAIVGRRPAVWLLVLVVCVLGIGRLLFGTAFQRWLPAMIGRRPLMTAYASLEMSDAASTLAGPSVGGGLVQAVGAQLALGADALSYALSAITIYLTRGTEPLASPSSSRVHAGRVLRTLLGAPSGKALFVTYVVLAVTSGSGELLVTVLAKTVLGLEAWQAGLVFGAAGAGGLVGSYLVTKLGSLPAARGAVWIFVALAASALGLIAAASVRGTVGYGLAIASSFLSDLGGAAAFVLVGTWLNNLSPPDARGRIYGIAASFSAAARGAGLLGLGALAAVLQTRLAFGIYLSMYCICAISMLRLGKQTPWQESIH